MLNGGGSYDSVFIFQASSTLVTASNSVVRLENGAQACNVFWQVGSSATLGTGSTFVGTIMANQSATLNSTATVQGRVLALNAAVTLDANTITLPSTCKTGLVSPTTTTTTTSPGTTPTTAPGTTGDHPARHHRHHPARRLGYHRHHLARRLGWHRGGNFRYLGHNDRHGRDDRNRRHHRHRRRRDRGRPLRVPPHRPGRSGPFQ